MANAFHYSIGRKFIQAVSGAFLIIFLLLHATINFFSVIDSFTGKFGVVANDDKLFSAGDGLFQLGCDFMSTPVITIMVPVLALGFLIHIGYGIYLSYYNMRARGGVKRYEVASKAKADSWASTNMLVLGIVILGIVFFHLTHFWADMQLKEFTGGEAENPYLLLTTVFGSLFNLIVYLVWFVAVWYHLCHGFWSMFQTVGWSGSIWMK
ncbi:MAG: succinate dehydrogenase, partial [Bacteroidales bacterium]|nr:succinate dehydrogenase [Bacteroidales bacterium]